MSLPHSEHRALVATLVGLGITGGATHDALISVTAANAGAALLNCDSRAATTDERCGVSVRLLDGTAGHWAGVQSA